MSQILDAYDAEHSEDIATEQVELTIQQELLEYLHNYDNFVIMLMNCNVVNTICMSDVQDCIMHIFKQANGVADIKQAGYAVISCLPDSILEDHFNELAELVKSLATKKCFD
jgi:hypothetical protein